MTPVRHAGSHLSNNDSFDRKNSCVGDVSGARHHVAMRGLGVRLFMFGMTL